MRYPNAVSKMQMQTEQGQMHVSRVDIFMHWPVHSAVCRVLMTTIIEAVRFYVRSAQAKL